MAMALAQWRSMRMGSVLMPMFTSQASKGLGLPPTSGRSL